MSTGEINAQEDERITLLIGSGAQAIAHAEWVSYDVDSQMLTPADGWSLALTMQQAKVPSVIQSGAPVQLKMGNDVVMTGRVDDVDSTVSKGGTSLAIKGRDDIGQLLDCSAPIFGEQHLTFESVVAKIVKPLGLTKIDVQGASTAPKRDKIIIQPGESGWEALVHAVEAAGMWPWMEPDGTLTIGGPNYSLPPVAMLVHRIQGGEQNNVLSVQVSNSMARSYSEVTVLAQSHGGGEGRKTANVKADWRDPSVTFYRPKIVIDHEIENVAMGQERAKKLVTDARLERWTCTLTLRGHRINCPGWPGHGQPWRANVRVHLVDESHGLDGIYYVIGRRMTGGRDRPKTTTLTLKEDGAWIVAAHPHKRRNHRKSAGPGEVWDASHGADPVKGAS